MNDWTEVRYGRRRWRRPQGTRDWSRGRPEGRVDSAPSFRFRREDFPFPNQPVPPPSATWYPGPCYRSYADAVDPGQDTESTGASQEEDGSYDDR
ncbi:hypothetical protein D9C73_000081 [Collichthys lucidus]|uniref:Uncharacterized protein n=1 Tax=Collichthys lucidus TaxID=240159 RepID=A0A4U5TWD7_COLLU|nr:hypothetical protein D9C73_000012 [Collichthys lucidus]TKS66025.1 hypothetical protein D9C73_000081 [Collichthys lucidus]